MHWKSFLKAGFFREQMLPPRPWEKPFGLERIERCIELEITMTVSDEQNLCNQRTVTETPRTIDKEPF